MTVDCYNDEEQLGGLLVGAEDAFEIGEVARVVDTPVRVIGVIDGPDVRRGPIAVCERDGQRFEVSLVDVDFEPGSQLGRVAAAYRRWLGCDS